MTSEPAQGARLAGIGWRAAESAEPVDLARLARVIAQHRNGYVLHDGEREFNAQPAPRFLRRDVDPVDRPAVGDFVLHDGAASPHIEHILPRRSLLLRGAAGERYRRQAIAANIDHVLVLMGLDGDFNPRRIERYLLLIAGSGAQGVVVLTKADRAPDVAEAVAAVQAVVPPDTPVHAVNAKDAASLATLHPYLGEAHSVVLVGSSGVGKSTLTNTLLGSERMATGAVRTHDSRGRHTTTHRALIRLPQGGCLIDTPGMRELKLTGEEELDAGQFGDIDALAAQCRFGDCAHGHEPGCAVRAALESGALDPARWASFAKLRGELDAQAESLETQLKRKAQAKVMNKALGQRLKDKYGRR
ncbi:MAG: ribosome small subunit-dependent GTPase A [Lysobacterales bacterium]